MKNAAHLLTRETRAGGKTDNLATFNGSTPPPPTPPLGPSCSLRHPQMTGVLPEETSKSGSNPLMTIA